MRPFEEGPFNSSVNSLLATCMGFFIPTIKIFKKLLLHVYQNIHFVPLYIEDSLRLNSQQHSSITRYSNVNFICPKFKWVAECGRTFAVSTCQLWNSLSLQLRNAASLESFKNKYRNNLFKEQQELHHFIV